MVSAIGKFARYSLHTALRPALKDGAQRSLVVSSTMAAGKGVALYWFLRVVGLDPSPLLAVFGMAGAAVGFASKDFISNFISGASLAAGNTFQKGDKITIGSASGSSVVNNGVIVDMDMKYLYLEQDNGSLVLIPNAIVTNSVVSIAGAAARKREEDYLYNNNNNNLLNGSLLHDEDLLDSEGLTIDSKVRRGRRIIFVMVYGFPTFVALVGMLLTFLLVAGFISEEELRQLLSRTRWRDPPTVPIDEQNNNNNRNNKLWGYDYNVGVLRNTLDLADVVQSRIRSSGLFPATSTLPKNPQ